MKARYLESIIKSKRLVHRAEGNLRVGTSMCSRLISIDMSQKPLEIKYALDTWKEGRKCLKGKDEIARIWDSLQNLIDTGEIWDIWNGHDEIENKLPVYYVENGHLIESHTDKYGWPNTTYDGVIMYENTHFPEKRQAIEDGIKDAEYWIKNMKERKEELHKELKKKDELIQREKDTIKRLRACHC